MTKSPHQDDLVDVPPPQPIVRRQVDIDFDLPFDRPWLPANAVIERMLNTVSLFFPEGEKYLIESVRHYQAGLKDPVLRDQVRGFVFQETMHSRQHDAANALLKQYYRRGADVERLAQRHLAFWRRILPPSARLAVSCAIEDLTATAAATLLHYQDDWEALAEPAFSELWLWHAVEESEHKSVCFDVYRAAVGTGAKAYALRVLMMLLTTAFFFATLIVGMRMLGPRPPLPPSNAEPRRFSRGNVLALLGDVLPWRHSLAYYRPSFHPSDFDCTDLIQKWKARFPDFGIDPLAGRAELHAGKP